MSTDRSPGQVATLLAIAGLLCAAFPLAYAQSMKEDATAMDAPEGKAAAFSAKAGTAVKALKRLGFWVQIEAQGKAGWVKASALSFSAGLGGPVAIDTGRLGRGNIVATSAARGLSAKDLLNGTPRPDDVQRLAGFAVDVAAVQGFTAQGSMQAPARAVALVAPPVATPVAADTGRTGTPGRVVTPSMSNATRRKDSDEW